MKVKHYSLIFSVIFMSIFSVFSIYIYLLSEKEVYPTVTFLKGSVNTNQHAVNVPEDRLNSIVKNVFLHAPDTESEYAHVDLSFFGYKPVVNVFNKGRNDYKNYSKSYDISMSLVFDVNRYCVIDNKFYKEGDRLGKNIIVKTIQKKRVLIEEHGKEQWHHVRSESLKNKEINNESFALTAR